MAYISITAMGPKRQSLMEPVPEWVTVVLERDTECYSKSMAMILMLICAVYSERPPETSTQKFPDPQ